MIYVLGGGAIISSLLCLIANILVLPHKRGATPAAFVAVALAVCVMIFSGWYMYTNYRSDFWDLAKFFATAIFIIAAIAVACVAAYHAVVSKTHTALWISVSIVALISAAFSLECVRQSVSILFEEMLDAGKSAFGIEEQVPEEEKEPKEIKLTYMPDTEWGQLLDDYNKWQQKMESE